MIFGRKKIVSAIFARKIRLYSRAAQKRKNLKSRNLAFFLVFRVIKYVQSFKMLPAVVFKIDRGGDLHLPPACPILENSPARKGLMSRNAFL